MYNSGRIHERKQRNFLGKPLITRFYEKRKIKISILDYERNIYCYEIQEFKHKILFRQFPKFPWTSKIVECETLMCSRVWLATEKYL